MKTNLRVILGLRMRIISAIDIKLTFIQNLRLISSVKDYCFVFNW